MGGIGGGLEEMQPIFRQVNPEWSNQKEQLNSNIPTKPFFFHVHTSKLHFCINVTDFFKNTFQAIKSVGQLEDLKDTAGIGGPLTEFVEYLKDSLTSEDLKLVLEGQSKSGGSVSAKVIAQKSDGMPTISVSLTKLVEAAASEAMANISLELFKQFKNVHGSLISEQQQRYQLSLDIAEQQQRYQLSLDIEKQQRNQLSKILAAEQEKNDATRKELHASHALVPVSSPKKNHSTQKEHDSSPASRTFSPSVSLQEKNDATRRELHASSPASRTFSPSVSHQEKNDANKRELHASSPASRTFSPSVSRQEKNDATRRELHASPPSRTQKFRKIADLSATEKQRAKVTPSSEVTNRVIPSYRRQKVEGILLVDSGDERD